MLRELRIRDIAIVDDLALTFGAGLNVLTGETGAGKSIILQALTLLSGARATADLIRSGADEALVEGLFDGELPVSQREPLGLADTDDELVVRRHLSRAGKGRIHINGSPVTLAMLADLGDSLVHIYGQQEHALLLRPASHLDLLDRFGELGDETGAVAAATAAWSAATLRLDTLERRRAALEERRDLLEYQYAELAAATVEVGEEVALRQERELLRHAERVQQVCREGEAMLYSGDGAIATTLARLTTRLSELAAIASQLSAPADLVETGRVQLEEAALQLRAAADRLQADPERLLAVEERLVLIGRLCRKYEVAADALPGVFARIAGDRAQLAAHSDDAAAARAECQERHREALALARALSAARMAAARRLEQRMKTELEVLGMRGALFRVVQQTPDDVADILLAPTGIDQIEFFLAANPGEEPKPLARVASGGELSRIMLALKALTAAVAETPILIFDEVDTGIGGTVADAVAKRLKALARTRQVLCITHLPQIAAYADQHFAVEKNRQRDRTITRARALDADERVAEVSRMLGGATAPAEAERYARRLLAEAQRAP
jgi:DNA repair protein RecN (Recombination protein N)